MNDATGTNTVLKILSGVQAGVEVSLVPGDYTFGSGADDIQIIDVALKPGHARLRVGPGKIEVAGAAGSLRSADGLVFTEAGDFQEVQPLDVLSAGTTRFALGPPGANWASVTEDDSAAKSAPRKPVTPRAPLRVPGGPYGVAAGIAGLAVLAGIAYFLFGPSIAPNRTAQDGRSELEIAQEAIAPFTFARNLQFRREVDGTIYLTGYVESPVERRAVAGAIEASGMPVYLRIGVLSSMREEIARLIEAQKANITFTLAPNGAVTLEGTLLDPTRASAIAALVRDNVLGIGTVTSNLRTADTLLTDAQRLAQQSQIEPFVMLRLDGSLIEANGTIPVYKIDSWVGFLQAYAARFAKDIPLRSYVQLQGVAQAGPVEGGPGIVIGANAADGRQLDVDTLRQGTFKLSDVFVNQPPDAATAAAAAAPVSPLTTAATPVRPAPAPSAGKPLDLSGILGAATAAPTPTPTPAPTPMPQAGSGTGPRVVGQGITGPAAPPAQGQPGQAAPLPAAAVPVGDIPGTKADDMARNLLLRWAGDKLGNGDARLGASLKALEQGRIAASAGLSEGEQGTLRVRYGPLFGARGAGVTDPTECWPGSRVKASNVISAIFWLDLLSVSDDVSLTSFDAELQPLLLQAALDPARLAACAARNPASAQVARSSVYLNEVKRNPDFVAYIVRDLKPYPLDIVGADTTADRFIQTRAGTKLHEGAAPDANSRIASVGELGAVVQQRDGWSAVIFGPTIAWTVR